MMIAIVALWLGFAAPAASAHTTLQESVPAFGETVDELEVIELRFGDRIVFDEVALLLLTEADGTAISSTEVMSPDEFTLRIEVTAEDLARGTYIARYVVRSIDGDLNEGAIEFRYQPSGAGGAGTWVLLAVGLVAVAGVLYLLRPRPKARES